MSRRRSNKRRGRFRPAQAADNGQNKASTSASQPSQTSQSESQSGSSH